MFAQHDFLPLWAAGRIALAGGNPFDDGQIIAELLAAGVPLTHHPGGFYNPPWSIGIFAFFSLFPLPIAQVLWFVSSAAMLAVSAVLIAKMERETGGEPKAAYALPAVLATFYFYPVQKLLLFGQSTHIVLLGLVLFFHYQRRSVHWLAGLGLSLTFLKPHLLLPVYVLLGLDAVRSRRVAPACWGCLGLAIQCAVSAWICPRAFRGYGAYIAGFFAERELGRQVTLGHALGALFGHPGLVPVTVLLGLSLAVALAWRNREMYRSVVDCGIPVSLLTAPYAWSHDHVLLLFPLMGIVLKWHKARAASMWIGMLVLSLTCWLTVAGEIGKREIYLVLLPLAFLIYGILGQGCVRKPLLKCSGSHGH